MNARRRTLGVVAVVSLLAGASGCGNVPGSRAGTINEPGGSSTGGTATDGGTGTTGGGGSATTGGGTTEPGTASASVELCRDVVCNDGEGCVNGECLPLDPCWNVVCDAGGVCVNGTCFALEICGFVARESGETCINGACVLETAGVDPCVGITCNAGETYVGGVCTASDPCANVTCTDGETCESGECIVTDPVAKGAALYLRFGCGGCHGADASGASEENIQGKSKKKIWKKLRGIDHPLEFPGSTEQDAEYIAAWLDTL